jgi:hypothetical protein
MTELKNWKQQEDHIFACDCGDGHYLRIRWDNDDTDFRFLWLEADSYRYKKLKSRLKDAWKLIIGKPCTVAEVILDDSVCLELRDFLNTKIDAEGKNFGVGGLIA